MNLALANAPESEETKNFVKGFEMIRTKLEEVLDKEGVTEIDAEGKPFDAATMQAVMQEPADGVEPGTVDPGASKRIYVKRPDASSGYGESQRVS